jgi:hypothetical protein
LECSALWRKEGKEEEDGTDKSQGDCCTSSRAHLAPHLAAILYSTREGFVIEIKYETIYVLWRGEKIRMKF